MVFPGGMGMSIAAADPPPECAKEMAIIRYCTMIVMCCFVGSLAFGSLPFGDLLFIMSGIFICKDDIYLNQWHTCLMRSPFASCGGPGGGGGSCLLPYMVIGGLDFCIGIFSFLYPASTLPFLLISLMAQGFGAYAAYNVLSVVRGSMSNTDYLMGGGDGLNAPLHAPTQQQFQPLRGGPEMDPNFQPFQGTGQRLGA